MGKKRRVNARPNKFGAKHGHLLRGNNRPNNTATVSNSVVAAKVVEAATVSDIEPIVEEVEEETPIVEEVANVNVSPVTTNKVVAKTNKTATPKIAKASRNKKTKVKTNQVD